MTRRARARPAGIAPGSFALAAAWVAAALIALLTGAAAVVILLAAGTVGFLIAAIAGWSVLRRTTIAGVTTTDLAVVGDELRWEIDARTPRPIWVELRVSGAVVASGTVDSGRTALVGSTPRRGVHDRVEVVASSAGASGLLWWRRSHTVELGTLVVAPEPADEGAPIDRRATALAGDVRVAERSGRDRPSGVRPWREGDEATSVHWPSSLRAQELIVRHLLRDADEQWIVRVRSGTSDPDAEAARAQRSLDEGLRAGASVVAQLDDGDPDVITTRADAMRWCAAVDPVRATGSERPTRRRNRFAGDEPERRLEERARWLVAAAGAAPLVMLLQPLGYGIGSIAMVLAVTGFAAALTTRLGERRRVLRQLAGVASALAVAGALIDLASITSVASSLRFLMPQILVTLVVLQGFECVDRRSARVAMSCSAILTAYAAGVRIDQHLGLWLLVTASTFLVAFPAIMREPTRVRRPPAERRSSGARRLALLIGAATSVLVILAVVPVPRGPAQLTLPSWLEERRETAGGGGLAAADGSPLLGGSGGRRSGSSTGDGGVGSYAGFEPSMDTSLRGDLGDEVVLRVKAPFPDFWRGQTFATFDGRSWHVDDRRGALSEGPDHAIAPAEGDARWSRDHFVQTFYPEVDLPNIVFAAVSARRVLLDAPLWQRPDGAMRAGVVLPAGSAYTVVSARGLATADGLRAQGDVSGRPVPPRYVQVPDSTTDRVRDLAAQLAAGSTSTYDTILAIEAWLSANVRYDLDAPVPPAGADAVDHFLFESRLGFCEQIASAMAIMLRTLDIPARVASGYVPSSRDGVAGVWISRARDAHAWVEVHFPRYGWVAFDPTADVPLSGEAGDSTIGGELIGEISAWVAEHVVLVLALSAAAALTFAGRHLVAIVVGRRRRGRWGVLQDRFAAAAARRGAPPTASNAELADAFDRAPDALELARALDASAFSPTWTDDDEEYARLVAGIGRLESAGRSR